MRLCRTCGLFSFIIINIIVIIVVVIIKSIWLKVQKGRAQTRGEEEK
jgi:uncharacterized protein YpmB